MKQRMLAALLALGMVFSMLGCAGSETGNTETKEKVSTETQSEDESSTVGNETESTSLLPWTGEEITLSVFWFDWGGDPSKETPISQTVQEKLGNIKLEVETLPLTDYQTKLPLLMASGELQDIVICDWNVYDYLPTYADSGVFLDFAELMDEYMPNVAQYVDMGIVKGLADDEGHQYALPANLYSEDYVMRAWVANTTLLEELEIEIPETQEAFLEACRKVKEETGITPIQTRDGLNFLMTNCIGLMYKNMGDTCLAYYPEEGKWDFGPTREDSELKSLLTFMNILWEENLIDHEINTMSQEQAFDYIYGGEFAFVANEYVTRFAHDQNDSYLAFVDAYDFEVAAIPTPEGTGAHVRVDGPSDGSTTWAFMSNANTEYPELVASIIDLAFSEEMADLKNYGIEGTSYEISEDGQKNFKDNMQIPYNYYAGDVSLEDVGVTDNIFTKVAGIIDVPATQMKDWSPEIYEDMQEIYSLLDNGELQPYYVYGSWPTLNEEEMSEASDIVTPVNTYLSECLIKFVMGDMDLDKDWDTFMEKLQGYGDMNRVCEILNSKEMPVYTGNWR